MRIVVRAPEIGPARKAQEMLGAAGVEAEALGADHPNPEGADVAIVVGPGPRETVDLARRIARQPNPPLAIVAAADRTAPPRPGLAATEPIDCWAALNGSGPLLARQIATAARAGVARRELRLRLQTAAEQGVEPPAAPRAKRLSALYIGAPSPFFLALERTFAVHRGAVRAAFSSFTGFDHLHDDHFDAVALNGATDPATAIALCAALRRNGGLHHMPTLVVTRPNDCRTRDAAVDRGAAALIGEDESSELGVAWLFDAIRRERRRAAVERELRALRERLGDPTTGLFNADVFATHLARLADDHHATGRPLSLLALRISPAAAGDTSWRKGFREVAGLATELVRDADCCAALDWNLIGAALPATSLAGAQRAAQRIASVVECASFAAGDSDAPAYARGAAELKPGESGRALMARTLESLAVQGRAA